MNFRDIKLFTESGSWECNFPMGYFAREIDRLVEEEGLQLNPDFQRGHVWTDEQSSKFIEFVLQGGKTAKVIYLNKPSWNMSSDLIGGYDDFVCVDGLQRIVAIRKFMANQIKAFENYRRDFVGRMRGHCDIRLNINDLKTKKAVLQWYLEMNSGGVVHSAEELNRVRLLLEKER